MEKRPIFLDDVDREDLLRRMDVIFPECSVECLAWALIPNHFHLVLRTGPTPLSRIMSRLGTGYARRFNERHHRVGHLFQNRYLSRPVRDDGDLLGVIRYVHANPVRHGIVGTLDELAEFGWCGHGALIGTASPRAFHAVDPALRVFGATSGDARIGLGTWMARELEEAARPQIEPDAEQRLELACRSPRVARGLAEPGTAMAGVLELVARLRGVSQAVLLGPSKVPAVVEARALAAHLARQHLGLSNRQIARALRVSERSAARGVALGTRLAQSIGTLEMPRARSGESPNRRERPRQ